MKPYPPGSSLPRKIWLTFMARVDAVIYWINNRVR